MSNSVCTLHTTILPPFSETVVPTLLPPRYSSDHSICEPLPMNKGQKFICARSAIDSSQSIAACKLMNPTNQVIWLPRHKALGILEPIHSEALAVMTPSETPHTDMNTTPTAHPHHSPATTVTHAHHNTRQPPSLDELGVIYQSESLSAEENSRLKDLLQANINVFSANISDLQSTPYIQQSVLCYLDDILIYSATFDEHLKHLTEVFQRPKDAKLKLNPPKCNFGLDKILYLGHVLSPKGMEVDKSKIDVIDTYPRPTNHKEIRAFLGLAGYYRKFIKGFSIIANPLNRLLRKDMEFIWDDECEAAFIKLKQALNSAPVLIYPDVRKDFIINCDVSSVGIGYVLAQEDEGGREHPICYGGRSLTFCERNYAIAELECLSLIESIKQFNCYLANSFFTVYTDHLNLKYLQNMKTTTNGRLLRWSLALQGYNFKIAYKAGKCNQNADALSRRPYPPTPEEVNNDDEHILAPIQVTTASASETPDINIIMEDDLASPSDDADILRDIAEQQRLCPDIAPIIQYLEQGDLPSNDTKARCLVIESSEYALDNGVLYHYYQPRSKGLTRCYINQLVVPKSLRQRILNGFHEESSHPGFHRCYLSIRRKYFWKHMHADVQRHIASCQPCQQCKYPVNLRKAPLRPLEPKEIFGRWSMDILQLPESKEGYRYILLCVENLTSYPKAIPLKDQIASTIAQALYREIFTRYGPPETLLSDRGPNFMSSIVSELSKLMNIRRIHTAAYNPRCNSQCERLNRSIWQSLRIHCTTQSDWLDFIPAIMFSFRAMTSQHLGHSPFFLLTGKEMRNPVDLQMALPEASQTTNEYVKRLDKSLEAARQSGIENTLDMQAKNKQAYDVGTSIPPYTPGDLVWVFNPLVPRGKKGKMYKKFTGPYYITTKVAPYTYILRDAKTNKQMKHPVNADRLKPYVDRRDYVEPDTPTPSSPPANTNDPTTPTPATPSGSAPAPWQDAERLSGVKLINRKRYYKVIWKDASQPPSWVPETDVSDCLKTELHITRTMLGKRRKRATPQRFQQPPTPGVDA